MHKRRSGKVLERGLSSNCGRRERRQEKKNLNRRPVCVNQYLLAVKDAREMSLTRPVRVRGVEMAICK
ncbi:hypothetical protein RvY_05577 [Ramazzottius varieornatus]|uniref:Uncharacterized protein n=1 Tax=Ramazzottius varieornatus TaxID=947166 RepID=A0A1D1V5B9_RAMVA|nr:hypothetical protein RvY_05577 [Ramazzottius varieornatus]